MPTDRRGAQVIADVGLEPRVARAAAAIDDPTRVRPPSRSAAPIPAGSSGTGTAAPSTRECCAREDEARGIALVGRQPSAARRWSAFASMNPDARASRPRRRRRHRHGPRRDAAARVAHVSCSQAPGVAALRRGEHADARRTPDADIWVSVSARNGCQFRMPTWTGSRRPRASSALSSADACFMVNSVSGDTPPKRS